MEDLRLKWVMVSSMSCRNPRDSRHVYNGVYRGLKVALCTNGKNERRFGLMHPRNPMHDPLYQCGTEAELLAFIDNLPRAKFDINFSEVLRLRALCDYHGIDPDSALPDILLEPAEILLSELK